MFNWLAPKESNDIYVLPVSDLHAGSTAAVFPYWYGQDLGISPPPQMRDSGTWRFKHSIYTPTNKQIGLFSTFTECAKQIAEKRKGKRLVILGNGDMIDGAHHGTHQLATHNIGEQREVAVFLLKYLFSLVGFDKSKGDKFFMVQGTESHDGDEEDSIASQLQAETYRDRESVGDFLQLDINGKLFWLLHQGAGVGKGMNKGNALRNWMKNKYIERLEEGLRPPDVVMSGHYHEPWYEPLARNNKIVMHGMILPAWQLKTRFGYRVAAAEFERVGFYPVKVFGDGRILVDNVFIKRQSEEVIKV